MRLIYPKGKKYRLGRRADERWHLMRNLLTQLITHDRIKTTYHKAKYLRPLAERVISRTKKYKNQDKLYLVDKTYGGHITTPFAKNKLKNELMEQFSEVNANFTRVVRLNRRKGDNALTAYIELVGNRLEKYEKDDYDQRVLSGEIKLREDWEKNVFNEEKDFFEEKISNVKENLDKNKKDLEEAETKNDSNMIKEIKQLIFKDESDIKFFNKQLDIVNHDLFILNKSKYDIVKYPRIY